MKVIEKLLESRKAMVTVFAVIACTIMAIAGAVQGESVMEFLKVLIPVWVGAQAYEDATKAKA